MKGVLFKISCFIFLLHQIACGPRRSEQERAPFAPKVAEAKGISVPPDSLLPPKVVPAGEARKSAKNTLKTVPVDFNVHPVPPLRQIRLSEKEKPAVSIPRKAVFKSSAEKEKKIRAGNPEVIEAKDAAARDLNPANFTFYKVLQGLKQFTVRSVYQDSKGNLWFGTYSGGVSRFDGKFFTHFTEAEGLSNNVVFSILEDKQGNMWFGTNGGGASRYDGTSFTHFTTACGMKSDMVFSICEDKAGKLWFGTSGGVCYYDGSAVTSMTLTDDPGSELVFNVSEDSKGRLWFGTHGKGAICYNGTSLTHYTEAQGLVNNIVLSVEEDVKGSLWFGTVNGVTCFDGHAFTNYTETEGLAGNVVYDILQDKSGTIWFCTYKGCSSYDGSAFTSFTEAEGLSSNVVYCVLEDRSGSFWLGTSSGLSHYSGRAFTFFSEKQGLSHSVVFGMLEDKKGNLWFGTNGGGVSRYDGRSFTHFDKTNGLSDNVVYAITEDRQGHLWFATDAGGITRYDGRTFTHYAEAEGLSNNMVYCIQEDKKGNLWLGTEGGGVSCFDGKSFTHYTTAQGLASNVVYCIGEDKKGDLWFGTYNGISCYDGKNFINYGSSGGLISNIIYSILEDREGALWFGSNAGVSRYDGRSFMHFTEQQGLINNAVLSILEDQAGNIWFGTRMGLSRIRPGHLRELIKKNNCQQPVRDALFYNYGYNDGFLGVNCRRNSVLQDSKGNIWWGADMLTRYTPEGDVADTSAPVMHLAGLKLFNEEISWAGAMRAPAHGNSLTHTLKDTVLANGVQVNDVRFNGLNPWNNLPAGLSLSYDNNNLTFKFVGVHLQNRNHISYQYQLEGLDKDWSAISRRTEAPYGNLPPGSYTFRVKAMNQSGLWSEPHAYSFTILPPWWQTWWFRGTLVLLAIALVRLYVKWRERESKRYTKMLRKQNNELLKTNAELDKFVYSASHELRAPLASVMGLVNLSRQDEAHPAKLQRLNMMQVAIRRLDNFIGGIVEYSRNSRLEVESEKIDFQQVISESIEQQSYMPEREKVKINVDIQHTADFYSDKERIKTLFNNLLSNGIKYSAAEKQEPYVNIVVNGSEDTALIKISDNGIGIPSQYHHKIFDMFYRATEKKAGSGLGLYIVKEILDKLSGSIRVKSEEGAGTTFLIAIPNYKKEK